MSITKNSKGVVTYSMDADGYVDKFVGDKKITVEFNANAFNKKHNTATIGFDDNHDGSITRADRHVKVTGDHIGIVVNGKEVSGFNDSHLSKQILAAAEHAVAAGLSAPIDATLENLTQQALTRSQSLQKNR